MNKYSAALKSLMPPGKIWRREPFEKLLMGFSLVFVQAERYIEDSLGDDFFQSIVRFLGPKLADHTLASYQSYLSKLSESDLEISRTESSPPIFTISNILPEELDAVKNAIDKVKLAHIKFEYKTTSE